MTETEILINKAIVEKLFGECWHDPIETFVPDFDIGRNEPCMTEVLLCKCGLEWRPHQTFEDFHDWDVYFTQNYNALAEARKKIAEKGLQQDMIVALYKLQPRHGRKIIHEDWAVLNASAMEQATAIYNVLGDK